MLDTFSSQPIHSSIPFLFIMFLFFYLYSLIFTYMLSIIISYIILIEQRHILEKFNFIKQIHMTTKYDRNVPILLQEYTLLQDNFWKPGAKNENKKQEKKIKIKIKATEEKSPFMKKPENPILDNSIIRQNSASVSQKIDINKQIQIKQLTTKQKKNEIQNIQQKNNKVIQNQIKEQKKPMNITIKKQLKIQQKKQDQAKSPLKLDQQIILPKNQIKPREPQKNYIQQISQKKQQSLNNNTLKIFESVSSIQPNQTSKLNTINSFQKNIIQSATTEEELNQQLKAELFSVQASFKKRQLQNLTQFNHNSQSLEFFDRTDQTENYSYNKQKYDYNARFQAKITEQLRQLNLQNKQGYPKKKQNYNYQYLNEKQKSLAGEMNYDPKNFQQAQKLIKYLIKKQMDSRKQNQQLQKQMKQLKQHLSQLIKLLKENKKS